MRKATLNLDITPIFCGSAFKNKGVQRLLDGILDYLPSPLEVASVEGVTPNTNEPVRRHPGTRHPFSAIAFKIATDPFVGKLTFFRVYSGVAKKGTQIYNATTAARSAWDVCCSCMRTGGKMCRVSRPAT